VFRNTAHLYDLIYEASGKDYKAESAQLHELIQARNPNATSLLDVACGTGVHLAHLQRWYDVAGVDLDRAMLAEARRRLSPDVPLVEADMRYFALSRRFDAVICLFSSVGYMSSVDELRAAVTAMAGHLAPGGVLVIDGWVRPDQWIEPGTVHVVLAEKEGMSIVRASRSRREGNLTYFEMHHLVATLERIDHLVDHHTLTLFAPGEYEAALAGAGLSFEVMESPMPGRDRYVARQRV
jgi:dTDP-3-amino-3,6-dideoxy-alpha-D-glucopyranose N,N-dimethyltransferase/dTDP-3-amino-3,4,6-trideoxy-alpha-D-glucopyranose N,N-dimethyltransferase/N-methyltransferase